MEQHTQSLSIATRGAGLYEFTDTISALVQEAGMREGLLTVFAVTPRVRSSSRKTPTRTFRPTCWNSFAGWCPSIWIGWFIPPRGPTTCPRISNRP